MQKVILRADGNSEIGLGHVFRLLGLAQALSRSFKCIFAISKPSSALKDSILSSGVEIMELSGHDDTDFIRTLTGAEIVVLDGYHFSGEFKLSVKRSAYKLVLFDDGQREFAAADMIINFGTAPGATKYEGRPGQIFLLGLRYLIVRPEFFSVIGGGRSTKDLRDVFICMGGADPFNVTCKALRACLDTGSIPAVHVVVGSAYQYHRELRNIAQNGNISIHSNLPARQMVELMTASRILLCTASSIALEACCVRGWILTGTVSDNQHMIHENLLHMGACVSVGNWIEATEDEIANKISPGFDDSELKLMMTRQFQAIDKLSQQRIFSAFEKLASC